MSPFGTPNLPELRDGALVLRGVRMKDARELEHALLTDRAWLAPWEATLPGGNGRWDVRASIRSLLDQAAEGTVLPMVLEVDGHLVGQVTVSSIQYGAVRSATLGYWVASSQAGKGLTPTAVALITDFAFTQLHLHRMEICIRPENAASLRVVAKLGFRYEGLRRRFIHIDGDWRDHFCFGLVAEEVPQGVLARWQRGGVDESVAAVPRWP